MPRWPRLAPLILLVMLVACTAPPPDAPTPVKAAPVVGAPAPTPVKVDEPMPTTAVVQPVPIEPVATPPVTPPSGEPLVSWWCVCDSRVAAVEAEKVTACRATEAECHALERAVRQGNKGMVARSLSRPCLELKAAHPGDVHGGRGLWSPSKKPGSWLSVGFCRLPGDGDLVQNEHDAFKVMTEERIGGKGGQSITAINVKAPATFKTRLGIGIGSSRKEVLGAYGKLRDPEFPSGDNEEVFLAGSIYGGVFFTFNKKDQVSEIFVGAGAA